ncbi:DUF397 domain-containing protein [Spirillospora sp. NPDC127200]
MILWRKASRSNAQGGDCVEVSTNVADRVLIRDSKDPHGPRIALDHVTLGALLEVVKRS